MRIHLPNSEVSNTTGTNYIVLGDGSGSMWHSVEHLKSTLLSVTETMSEKDSITLCRFASYNDYEYFVIGLRKNDNLDKLINKKFYASGCTCYTQALAQLQKIIDDVTTITGNSNTSLYFLSDGYPNSHSPESEIYRLCANVKGKFNDAVIVGYGVNYGRTVLLEMSTKIGGRFNHISDLIEMDSNYKSFFAQKSTKKNVKLDTTYDLVWQVTDSDIIKYDVNINNSVDVLDTVEESKLYAISYKESHDLDADTLTDASFVYSLAYILSQSNNASFGVGLLKRAGATTASNTLRKAFTVMQKGSAENELKALAIKGGKIEPSTEDFKVSLKDYLVLITENLGKISINLDESDYRAISRKSEIIPKVKFESDSSNPVIINVVGNEDRPNISFLTVKQGHVVEVLDKDLKQKIDDYNSISSNKITFPIESSMYRNYAFIANGDFNFKKIGLQWKTSEGIQVNNITVPDKVIEIFEENTIVPSLKDFVNLNKELIKEKAHLSVLNFYIKNNSEVKHIDDLRVKLYGVEGAKLLEEMGLDYQLRYSPKRESSVKDENADFIEFNTLSAYLKGGSSMSASESYKKYLANKKPNVADDIFWPLFRHYDLLLSKLGKATFVEYCQTSSTGIKKTVDLLSNKLSSIKFFMISTNSWFSEIEKSDEFEYDRLVIKVKSEKEYL